jgi:peroxiredoxin
MAIVTRGSENPRFYNLLEIAARGCRAAGPDVLILDFMRPVSTAFAAFLFSALLLGQTGRRAPGFSLPDVNNQQHDLEDYRGKVVLVEIMHTTCAPCIPFSKVLEQVKTHYGEKVAVLSLTNPPDTPSMVKNFLNVLKVTYPILFDCGQVAFSYARPDPLRPSINIPHVYLVDHAGVIRGDYEYGVHTSEIFLGRGLYTEIDKLLGGKPDNKAR